MAVSTRGFDHSSEQQLVAHDSTSRVTRWTIWALTAAALTVLLGQLAGAGRILLDDLRYGRPRTYQLSAYIGRPEEIAAGSHLIAVNLDRQVIILEVPGGDTARMRTIPGPYLVGAGEDLTPVTMLLRDENADHLPDLLIHIKNEELLFLNRGDTFSVPTATERQALLEATRQP
jgi:hypothetical protein